MGGAGDASAGLDGFPAQPPARPGLVTANYTTGAERTQAVPATKPVLEVTFRDGLLTINANKATLSDVLFAVQQRTGAEVSIAAGAEQEKVVANLGPAPAPEVLAQLLNGSRFNFLILSAVNDPRQLDRVILSPRSDGGAMPLSPMPSSDVDDDQPVPPARVQTQPGSVRRLETDPKLPPEIPPAANDSSPDQ